MSATPSPVVAVIGSGTYALTVISALSDVVMLRRMRVVWLLPSDRGRATLFEGIGWVPGDSVELLPSQVSLPVAAVRCGPIDSMQRVSKTGRKQRIFCSGTSFDVDAVVVALEPFFDMPRRPDLFLAHHRGHRVPEINAHLKNTAALKVNWLARWQMEVLQGMWNSGKHRKYIQSSIVEESKRAAARGAGATPKADRDVDEEEQLVEDDDDIEIDRPTVVDLVLPLMCTSFAVTLMASSPSNSPELLFFAMDTGERALLLPRQRGLDDEELERICGAFERHYLVAQSDGLRTNMLRNVGEVDLSGNAFSSVRPLTRTFLSRNGHPIRSMLRKLNLSHNTLDQASVVECLRAVAANVHELTLSSLRLHACGLTDDAADALCSVVSKMHSLEELDVGGNSFSTSASASILQAARHHLKAFTFSHTNLQGCDTGLELLLSSASIEAVDLTNCMLSDSSAIAIGRAIVTGRNRLNLRAVALGDNADISAAGVCFLFECLCTLASSTSSTPSEQVAAQLSKWHMKGCSPIGAHEAPHVASAIQLLQRLESISVSWISQEQLAVQLLVECTVKYSTSLTAVDIDFVEVPSRCDLSEATPTGALLERSALQALETKLSANRQKEAARRSGAAGTGASTVSSAIDVGANAARSCGGDTTGIPLKYVRIDDSANHAAYAMQLNRDAIDEYRHRRLCAALSTGSMATSDAALFGGVASVPSVSAASYGYRCGSVDTCDPRWSPFCDAVVRVETPTIPSALRQLSGYCTETDEILVDARFLADSHRLTYMIGCGSRTALTDPTFSLACNSGAHLSYLSEIVVPQLRDDLLATLCPALQCAVPRRDAVGSLISNERVTPRRRPAHLLNLLSLPRFSLEQYAQAKDLHAVLNEVSRQVIEAQPRPCEVVVTDDAEMRRVMESRGLSAQSVPIPDDAAKVPAASSSQATAAAQAVSSGGASATKKGDGKSGPGTTEGKSGARPADAAASASAPASSAVAAGSTAAPVSQASVTSNAHNVVPIDDTKQVMRCALKLLIQERYVGNNVE